MGKPAPSTVAALCAAAAVICLPLTRTSEGEKLRPYRDPAHIVTWCYGETQGRPRDHYTSAECGALLQQHLASSYAPAIAACLPQVASERHIKMFAAFLDAAYNAGPGAACRSRMARSIRSGDLPAGCNGFYGWRTTVTDRRTGRHLQLQGLELRRVKEARLCAAGLV